MNGIVFNPSKFVFGREEVDFMGFTVTKDGYKPTNKLIEAIKNFPLPTNLTGIRPGLAWSNRPIMPLTKRQMLWLHVEPY